MNTFNKFFTYSLFLCLFFSLSMVASYRSSRIEADTDYDYTATRKEFNALTKNINLSMLSDSLTRYPHLENKMKIIESVTKFNKKNKTIYYRARVESRIPIMTIDSSSNDDILASGYSIIKLSPELFDELKKENSFCTIS